MDCMSGCDIRLVFYFFRPKTVHCSTKNAYTSEITFLALHPCSEQSLSIVLLLPEAEMQLLQPLCFYVRASPPKHTARHQNKKYKIVNIAGLL